MKKKERKGIHGRLLETRGLTIVDETLLCNRSRGGEGGGGGGGGGIVLRPVANIPALYRYVE